MKGLRPSRSTLIAEQEHRPNVRLTIEHGKAGPDDIVEHSEEELHLIQKPHGIIPRHSWKNTNHVLGDQATTIDCNCDDTE